MTRVIENPRQYQAACVQVERLEAAIRAFPSDPSERPNVAPELQTLERDTIQDVVDELRAEMAEYDALQNGTRSGRSASSLDEIPSLLVAAREAADMSIAELAERLGVTEANLQAHERTRYVTAEFGLILRVADVLNVRLRGYANVTDPASAAWKAKVRERLKSPFASQQQVPQMSDD